MTLISATWCLSAASVDHKYGTNGSVAKFDDCMV